MQTEIADKNVYATSSGLLRLPARLTLYVAIKANAFSLDLLSLRISTSAPMISWRRTMCTGSGSGAVLMPTFNCDTLRSQTRPSAFTAEHWISAGTNIVVASPTYHLGNPKGMVEHNVVRQPLEHVTRLHSSVYHVWNITNLDTVPHDLTLDFIIRENAG